MWLRKADLVTGIGLTLFGAVVLLAALNFRWDLASVRQAGWYTAPGIVPVGVATILVLQGLALSLHAARHGGGWEAGDFTRVRRVLASADARRAGLVALLLSVYVFGLVGRLHFTLASFLFLAAFMFLFEAGRWWKILGIAVAASAAISFAFQGIAGVPLP